MKRIRFILTTIAINITTTATMSVGRRDRHHTDIVREYEKHFYHPDSEKEH